jgi:hypothetical protein
MATLVQGSGDGRASAGQGIGPAPPNPMPGSRLAPPFVVPGAHFGAALGFLILGAAGLVWVAPELAAGRFLTPRLVGVTHLFTLGWITLSIFGSLYQFLPVALGEPIRSTRAAYLTLALFVPGLLAFASGLAVGASGLTIAGAALFGSALVLFCGNLAVTLGRSRRRDLTWWALAAACAYLFLTAVLGLTLTGNLRWSFMGAARWPALGVHVHLALAGWVLMVVIGVGHRLLPMFLLSHGAREDWGRRAAWLVAIGAGWLVVFHHAPALLAQWVPAALIAGGLASFLMQAVSYFRRSVKPRLDPGLRMAAAALGVLGAGLGLGGWALAAGWAPSGLVTAYVAAVILGLSLFVAAHYYKIVPFLVWYHRFGPLIGRRPVPTVAELYSARWAGVAAVLMTAGFASVVVAVLAGAGGWARLAAGTALVGVLVLGTQMVALARRQP